MVEARSADGDGFIVIAGPAAFFCQLRKSNRRRVLLDPASKFNKPRIVAAHALSLWDRDRRRRDRLLAGAVGYFHQDDEGARARIRVTLNRTRDVFKVAVTIVELIVDD